jgi:WD40 repeat protein
MSYVFLSHSSQNDVVANDVQTWLEKEGHQSIFLDHDAADGLVGGEPWEERLYTELRRCRGLIALVSPAWLASPWCLAEASHAQAMRKPVIALRIADIGNEDYDHAAPPVLRRSQGIEWRAPYARDRLKRALDKAGLDPREMSVWDERRAPFPGLASFLKEDAAVYFGREQEITDLLGLLRECRAPSRTRLVVIQGASGTGKSSLLRAGVLPRLERDPDQWIIVPPVRPYSDPLASLAEALSATSGGSLPVPPIGDAQTSAWISWIRDSVSALRVKAQHLDATVLLSIDQLEEVLAGGGRGDLFLLALRDVLATTDHRLLAVTTLRADFSATLQRHPSLCEPSSRGEILPTYTFQLGPMPRASFHAVIEGPASVVGLELQRGLTSRLVEEARTGDALPLLAFALRELWDGYGKGKLELALNEYEQFGGLETAVGKRAGTILDQLAPTPTELDSFLTTLLYGMADLSEDGQIVRRRMAAADVPSQARRLVEEFASARLLIANETSIEVAHEALFRRWDTLAKAIETASDNLRVRRRVEHAYIVWKDEKTNQASRLLQPGRPLEEARDLLARPDVLSNLEVRRFLDMSIAADQDRLAKASRHRWNQFYAVMAFAAAILLVVIIASWQWIQATERFAEAQRRESLLLASRSEQETARGNAVNGMLLALQGLPTLFNIRRWTNGKDMLGPDRPVVPETVGALIAAMAEQRELASWERGRHSPPPQHTDQVLAITPTPALILVIDRDDVLLINLADGSVAGHLHSTDPESRPFGLVVDTKTRTAITTRAYMGVDFWTIDKMSHIGSIQVQSKVPLRLALDSTRGILAAGSEDHSIYLVDIASRRIVRQIETGGISMAIAFSPDGAWLASAVTDRELTLRSTADSRLVELVARDGYREPTSLGFSSDGLLLAAAYRQGGVRVWNVSAPDRPTPLEVEGLAGSARTVVFAGSERVLAAGYEDGSIRVVDLAADRSVEHLAAERKAIASLTFGDASNLISLDTAGTLRRWTASPGYRLRPKLSGNQYSSDCVAFAANPPRLVIRRSDPGGFSFGGEVILQRLDVMGLSSVVRRESWGIFDSPPDCAGLAAAADSPVWWPRFFKGAAEELVKRSAQNPRRPSTTLLPDKLASIVKATATLDGRAGVGVTATGRIMLWDAAAVPIAIWNVPESVLQLDLSPDDRNILARMDNGEVRLWPIAASVEALVTEARSRLPHCLTLDEAADFGLVTLQSGTSELAHDQTDTVRRHCNAP